MAKRRLDTVLAERGLFPTRSRAAASVMAGQVLVGAGRRRAQKPGELVDPQEPLSVEPRPQYASRGGIKLANALAACELAVAGRVALDAGASTGGFTDCLLQHGARAVVAVDVGYGLLDYGLRSDERVRVLERTNARALTPSLLAPALGGLPAPDLATIDVSFISLAKVLEPVLACLAPGWDALALVKPQFEVGRERVGKGGVVREAGDRRAALVAAGTAALSLGARVRAFLPSGLPGPRGNRESFMWLSEPAGGAAGAGSAQELEALARKAEP